MESKNTGANNSGDSNSGDWNSGNRNSGYRNSGYWNSGYRNSGYRNSGYRNSGDSNSGDRNSGYRNSGDSNSGDRNSGNRNSGYRNSGDWNSGDRNSGDWNSGNRNSGYFNTDSPDKIQIFNQWVDMTQKEFEEKYDIYADIPLNRWIEEYDMTEDELKEFPESKQIGGYLKTLEFKEACVIWWNENPEKHKNFLELPAFCPKIFEEITGIDIKVKEDKMEEAMELLKKNGYKITK
jgi:hypothetical protein